MKNLKKMKKKMIPFNKAKTYDQEFLSNFRILKKKLIIRHVDIIQKSVRNG